VNSGRTLLDLGEEMSEIRLDNSTELRLFLKILAEESVKRASVSLAEAPLSGDPKQDYYENRFKEDQNIYALGEAEEDPQEEEEEIVTTAVKKEPPKTEEEETADVETYVEEDVGASLDSIEKSINIMRSGMSVDDSAIKPELEAYFDRLQPAERRVLQVFLRAIAEILTRAAVGADAPDPSDPPSNIKMVPGQEEKKAASPDSPPATSSKSPEDTRPPIRVNEKASLDEIRKRVQSLMSL